MASTRPYRLGYEDAVVLMTSLVIGVTTFDRLAVNFVSPFLVRNLAITNLQLGALSAVLSLAIAIMGYLIGSLSDAKSWRKQLLVPALVAFTAMSIVSGFAASFVALLLTRLLMGMVQGPINMITQSIIAIESSDHRRGRNLGIQSVLIFLLGPVLGPIVVTRVAETWDWPAVFFVATFPGALMALVVALWMRPIQAVPRTGGEQAPVNAAPANARNVRLCIGIAAMIMTWLVVQNTFLPVYLVDAIHLSPTQMATMLSVQGAAACLGGLALPAISDRVGRKSTLCFAALAGVASPLGALLVHDAPVLLTVLLFIGGLANGAMPLYAVAIPGESVAPEKLAATIAIILGTGELCGGVLAPVLAGRAADAFGLDAPLWIVAAAVTVAAVLATMLSETAPAKRRSSLATPAIS